MKFRRIAYARDKNTGLIILMNKQTNHLQTLATICLQRCLKLNVEVNQNTNFIVFLISIIFYKSNIYICF